MSLAQEFAHSLEQASARYTKARLRIARQATPTVVVELRTACRRLELGLGLLDVVFENKEHTKLATKLKRERKSLRKLARVQRAVQMMRKAGTASLKQKGFKRMLASELKARAAVEKHFRTHSSKEIVQRTRSVYRALIREAGNLKPWHTLLLETYLRATLRQITAAVSQIDIRDLRAIAQVRKSLRDANDQIDFLAEIVPDVAKQHSANLERIEALLARVCDAERFLKVLISNRADKSAVLHGASSIVKQAESSLAKFPAEMDLLTRSVGKRRKR